MEDGIAEDDAPFIIGSMGEKVFTVDVADCIYILMISSHTAVDLNSLFIRIDPDVLKC